MLLQGGSGMKGTEKMGVAKKILLTFPMSPIFNFTTTPNPQLPVIMTPLNSRRDKPNL